MLKDRYLRLSQTERLIFWIILVLSLILGVFASTVFDTLLGAPNFQYALVNAIPGILAILSLAGAVLIFSGKRALGSWVLLIGSFVGLLLAASQAEGYGLPAAFVLFAITLFVPLRLLEQKAATTALIVGLTGTISIIVVDAFWPMPRVPALAEDVNSARVASLALGIIILVAISLEYQKLSIRLKLLLLALGTGLVSIILVASATTYFTQQAFRNHTKQSLTSAAEHSMEQIDTFIEFQRFQIEADAEMPEVIAYLEASPAERESSKSELLALFIALSKSDPVHIGSYALLDANGIDIIDSYTDDIGVNKSDRDYFINSMTTRRTFVSPIRFSPTSPDHAFYLATPVTNRGGKLLGVMRIRYRSSVLQRLLQANNESAGEVSYGILLDEHNIIQANGSNPLWISRTLTQPDEKTYDALRASNLLPNIAIDDVSLDMQIFADRLASLPRNESFFSTTDAAWGSPVEVGIATSDLMPWKLAYVQPQSITLRVIAEQRRVIVITSLLTGILVALAGFVVANTITRPILSLTATAENIAGGNLAARASVNTQDEINTLALSFNAMTDRLRDILGSLERRVAERTADVEMARLLSERRADELQAIGEISRLVSSEQRLETLLPLITRLVSEKFDFYHTGIFLVDSTRKFAVLQAANSEGGQKMLARGHRLEVGHTGLVGNVAQTGHARIALDVGSDAVYFDNPDLPKTRSEMALPLNLRGTTLGVLDVQSTKPGAFTETDAKNLSILGDQIAIAIDNARLFGQNRQALAEVQSLYNQYLRQEWSSFGRQESQVGYHQSLIGGKPLTQPIDSDEIQRALQQGSIVVVDGSRNQHSMPSIVIPVRLRGQTIGVLNIKSPTPSRRWNQDELNLAQAVSDRLALALDNARLLFESQRQTAKEQKIGEVTAKIGASINMQNVLQTAVEELGRALPGSEVIIQFQSNGKQE